MTERLENMKIITTEDYNELSEKAAKIIASKLILKPKSILGLATGSTPIGTYKELIRLYNEKIISFNEAITFNLDEYYDLDYENVNSYHYFMNKNLFSSIDIKKENINIPSGLAESLEKECESYESKIESCGGVDIQILGIGRNGHIGFNEPHCKFGSTTHVVSLDEDTRRANARFFRNIEEVPKKAITMGIKTIMNAKEILLLVSGEDKSKAIYETVYGNVTESVPASVLQLHPNVTVIVDKKGAKFL